MINAKHSAIILRHNTEAFVNSSYANCINDRDVEGHAQIFAKFDNGVSATITLSGYSDVVYEAYYYFTKGALKLTSTSKLEMRREGEKVWTEVPDSNDGLAFVREIDEFCKYVRGEESNIPDGEYGKAIVKAIDALYACEQ